MVQYLHNRWFNGQGFLTGKSSSFVYIHLENVQIYNFKIDLYIEQSLCANLITILFLLAFLNLVLLIFPYGLYKHTIIL